MHSGIVTWGRNYATVTPPTRVRTNSPSRSRTRDSGAGGGRSNKERQRLQPLASVARAPLLRSGEWGFTQPLLAYIRYTTAVCRYIDRQICGFYVVTWESNITNTAPCGRYKYHRYVCQSSWRWSVRRWRCCLQSCRSPVWSHALLGMFVTVGLSYSFRFMYKHKPGSFSTKKKKKTAELFHRCCLRRNIVNWPHFSCGMMSRGKLWQLYSSQPSVFVELYSQLYFLSVRWTWFSSLV